MLNLQLYINDTKTDMFDDVSVSITDSIKKATDVGSILTAYSQQFKLPASKTNNKIFKHAYHFGVVDGFDIRRKHSALLKLNGADFQKGYIKLNSIDKKDNAPYSYNVQFFGEISTLKDRFGEDLLEDLDYLSRYNHEFNITNVRGGFEKSLKYSSGSMSVAADTSGEIIYPFITHTKGFQYTTTDGLYDITETGTPSSSDRLAYTDLKPAISVPTIISAIENKYNIEFTGTFLTTTDITQLWLWMHKRKGGIVTDAPETNVAQYIGSIQDMTKDSFTKASDDPSGYDVEIHDQIPGTGQAANSDWDKYMDWGGDNIPIDPDNNRDFITYKDGFLGRNETKYTGDVTITPSGSFTANYDFYLYSSNNGQYHITETGLNGSSGALSFTIDNAQGTLNMHDLAFKVTSETLDEFDIEINITATRESTNSNGSRTRVWTYSQSVTSAELITEVRVPFNMPKIKVVDFLKGLFKLFNCVAFAELENVHDSTYKIKVMPLQDYYLNGKATDITPYVDIESSSVERVTPYQTISFEFEEPSTFLAKKSNELGKFEFGNLKWTADSYSSGGSRLLFDGGEYNVKVPFEKMQYERLLDGDDDSDSQIMYGWFVNDFTENTPEPETGKALLFYLENRSCSTDSIEWSDATSSTVYNSANNVRADGGQTLNFNSEIDEFEKEVNNNSLFANFYEEYISSIYDATARRYIVSAYLPPAFMSNYSLNDKVLISGTAFNIEEITIDLTTGKSSLKLIKITGVTETYPIEVGCRYYEYGYIDEDYIGCGYEEKG